MAHLQEHFFKGGHGDAVAPQTQKIKVLIKIVKEILEFTGQISGDLIGNFT
jgi:hypothetical protein